MSEIDIIEIQNLLNELEARKIDVSKEKNELNDILNKNTTSLNDNCAVAVASNLDTLELEKLKSSLNGYVPLLKTYQIVEFLETSSISREEYIDLSNKLISIIDADIIVRNQDLLMRIHKILYEAIKREIQSTFDSKLLEKIMKDKLSSLYLSNVVKQEIDSLKSSSYLKNPSDLQSLQDELARLMIENSNYCLSKTLFLKIVKCENPEELQNLVMSKVANIKLQVTNFRKKFTDIQTNINNLLLKVNETIDDLEILENDIKKRIISCVLTASLLSGLAIGGTKLSKNLTTTDYYETEKETTIMDSEIHEPVIETYYSIKVKERDKLLLDVYSEYKMFSNSELKTFYLDKVLKNSDLEYLTIDLESSGVTLKEKFKSKDYPFTDPSYKGEIRILTKISQQEEISYTEYHNGIHIILCIILYIVTIASSFIPYFPIKSIIEIYKKSKERELQYLDCNNYDKELNKLLKDCYDTIMQNKNLAVLYNQILQSGILEKDIESIKTEIDELISGLEKDEQIVLKASKEQEQLQKIFKK